MENSFFFKPSGAESLTDATQSAAKVGVLFVILVINHPFPTGCSRLIYCDHSDSKYQTTATFLKLMDKIAVLLPAVRERHQLQPDAPALVVVDGAPAHNEDLMTKVHEAVFQVNSHKDMYILYTLPNRSHTLQVLLQPVSYPTRFFLHRWATAKSM